MASLKKALHWVYYGENIVSTPTGICAVSEDNGTIQTLSYVHTDYQGSWLAITDGTGAVANKYSYDAWGRPRDFTWNVKAIGVAAPFSDFSGMQPRFDHGYTGHEMLCGFGLINMNGRLYDPYVQRFLSPDSYVQSPENAQSYNRYTYCLNNPLKYTDPTGHFWNLIFGAAIGGTINWVTHGCRFDAKGLGYFAVGAVAGALGAGFAGGVNAALVTGAQASANATFMGGFTGIATATSSGVFSGIATGAAGGLASGFTTGLGNAAIEHKNIGKMFSAGIHDGVWGAIIGGAIGGVTGGWDAARHDRNIWTGAEKENQYYWQDKGGEIHVTYDKQLETNLDVTGTQNKNGSFDFSVKIQGAHIDGGRFSSAGFGNVDETSFELQTDGFSFSSDQSQAFVSLYDSYRWQSCPIDRLSDLFHTIGGRLSVSDFIFNKIITPILQWGH